MLKFLRKYKTWILVVGGTLLMIAFLLPANINRIPSLGGSAMFMSIDGRKVSMMDAGKASNERRVVMEVAPGMLEAFGVQEELDHWMLLVHAAEELGLVGGPDDGRAYLPDLAADYVTMMTRTPINPNNPQHVELIKARQSQMEQQAREAGGQLRMQEREVYQAIAKFRGIVRMYGLYASAGETVSSPRLALEARRTLDQGIVDYVFLPASSFTFASAEPTPEQIAAHFDKYKDVEPNTGEHGIGYRFGPRFQLEWLTLDRTALSSGVAVSAVDVRKAFMQETPGGTEEQFQAARAEIELRLKDAQIDKVMDEAAATVRAEIAKTLRKVESNGQYRELPADWMAQRPNYDAIAQAVAARLKEAMGLTVPPPEVTRRQEEWLTQSNLMTLQGIGQSTVRRGGRTGSFPQYVMTVKELAGPNEVGLQVGVPGDAVSDRQGNVYFFTITGFKPAGPPETAAEVQTQIVADLKRLAAYEKLKADAEAYRQQAIAGGLEAIAKPPEGSNIPMPFSIRRNVGVTRTDNLFMEQAINTDEIKSAILESVVKLDPKVDPNTIDAGERTLAIPVPGRLGLAVVVVKGYNATTTEWARSHDVRLARTMGSGELRDAADAIVSASPDVQLDEPFSLTSLAKRFNAELSVDHKSHEERRAKEAAEAAAASGAAAPTATPAPTPASTIGR